MVRSNSIIRNLLKDVGDNHFAVSNLDTSCAFAGDANDEIQFFRCRTGNSSNSFSARKMMYFQYLFVQNLAIIDLVYLGILVYI